MSTISTQLLKTLEELKEEQFERFKLFVTDDGVLEGSPRIPGSKVVKADKTGMVDLMLQQYEGHEAQMITLKVLEKIGRNDLVKNLKSSPTGPGLGQTPSVPTPTPSVSAVEKLRSARSEFISRVSKPTLHRLLDKLLDCGVVTDGEMESATVIANRADKAQEVIDTVRKKGEAACSDVIRVLCEVDRRLSTQLNLM